MTSVAVIGIGRIGSALVERLSHAGYNVVGFDIDDTRRTILEQHGARSVPDSATAAAAADIVLTALTGTPEIVDLVVTHEQLLASMGPDSVWVDLTSTAPGASEQCAREAKARGVASIDAPIGGGPDAVRTGQATLYIGGDSATVAHAAPVLHSFATTVHHVGVRGSGHLTKLLINLLWFGNAALVTEALLIAASTGLAADTFSQVLTGSAGDSAFAQQHLPALLRGDYLPHFGLDRVVEELDAIDAAARSLQLPHPVTTAIAELHREALNHFGPINGELLGASWLEHLANFSLHHD